MPHAGSIRATDEGIDAVEVVTATATVEKIDLEKRKVALLSDDDKKKTYKVDSRVQNLAQVKVGDHLEMSFTEEIAIVVGKSNETPGATSSEQISVAPNGAKPGIVMVETSTMSAQILGGGRTESSCDPARSGRQESSHKSQTMRLQASAS